MLANLLLLLTSIIWGFAFAYQRAGTEYISPFYFNAIRFFLGGVFLIPILLILKRINISKNSILARPYADFKTILISGLIAGLLIFLGSSIQQIAIKYTTAGKTGFITSFYVILVPIIGIFLKEKTSFYVWLGVFFAIFGIYFLSIKGAFTISLYDILLLISALFWAIHIHVIKFFSPKTNPIRLAIFQFLTCSFLSLIVAIFTEHISFWAVKQAFIPLVFTGILSVGIAYTLQIVAQKNAHPAKAAIILSLESVFSILGGMLVLSEFLSSRELLGCCLMFAGVIISQKT
jgi:drug/metabolite transporter (DMT)-like permease